MGIETEKRALLELLRRELTGEEAPAFVKSTVNWTRLKDMAERHEVLSVLYGSLTNMPEIPDSVKNAVEKTARKTIVQSYRLLFLSRYLLNALQEAEISTVLLKGPAAAACYPVPELRKSGDVDLLLLEPEKLNITKQILIKCGCRIRPDQRMIHHVIFVMEDGIEVELHTMLAEPFDNAEINDYLRKLLADCQNQVVMADMMGIKLPMLSPGYHAYQLLIHMLQHFLRAGFGLKLLCDWVVFWNREQPKTERQIYRKLVKESRLTGFSDAVTEVCCHYLGLERKSALWTGERNRKEIGRELMNDILEGGEFGRASADRMVSLQAQKPGAYIREFHHQMCLNFPKESRYKLYWPMLWIITLARFLRNNRTIRRMSLGKILRKTGERSRLTEKMELWK